MHTRFFLLAILLFTSFSSFATDSDLKQALSELRSKYQLPGIAAAFIQDDKVKEIAVDGVRKNGNGKLMETSDKFPLGSCGKAMTATLVGMFVEEEQLDWKSTLKELLPEIQLHPDYVNVTLEMLLAHRSGIRRDTEDFEGGWLYRELEKPEIDQVAARKLVAETLLTKPSEYSVGKFSYSNVGYMILGHILESLSGKSWEELIRQKLFSPLGMNSCGFGPTSNPSDEIPDQPWGHLRAALKPIHDDNPPAFGPAGRIHCNLIDWSKFLKMHLDGFNGKDGLVTVTTFKKLHTVYPDANSDYTYGGWYRLERKWAGGTVLTHSGTNTYNFANVWIAPKKSSILLSTANVSSSQSHSATNEAITDMIKRHLKRDQ